MPLLAPALGHRGGSLIYMQKTILGLLLAGLLSAAEPGSAVSTKTPIVKITDKQAVAHSPSVGLAGSGASNDATVVATVRSGSGLILNDADIGVSGLELFGFRERHGAELFELRIGRLGILGRGKEPGGQGGGRGREEITASQHLGISDAAAAYRWLQVPLETASAWM